MRGLLLESRGLLAITGADAETFLQGLISNDIRKVNDMCCIYATLLTPQGKFLHDFIITRWEDGFLLDTPKEGLADLARRLSFYKLRADVTLTPRPDLAVGASWGGEKAMPCAGTVCSWALQQILVLEDPRLAQLGERIIGAQKDVAQKLEEYELASWEEYERHRITLGVPEGRSDLEPDKSLLLEWGIDELGGVDFAKGCYVGQEVTARTRHRAQLRKFIHCVRSEEGLVLPAPGSAVMQDGKEIGVLRSSTGNVGIAQLQLTAREHQAEGKQITCEDIVLHAELPPWAQREYYEQVTR